MSRNDVLQICHRLSPRTLNSNGNIDIVIFVIIIFIIIISLPYYTYCNYCHFTIVIIPVNIHKSLLATNNNHN